jgi:hypothetical protein
MNKPISSTVSIISLVILVVFSVCFSYFQYSKSQTELNFVSIESSLQTRKMMRTAVSAQTQQATTTKNEKFLTLISPKGGESICIGDELIIKWSSKGVETVGVSMMKGGSTVYGIDQVLATRNDTGLKEDEGKGEYIWKAGYTMGGIIHGESEVNKIQISGGGLVKESGYFSLVNCNG